MRLQLLKTQSEEFFMIQKMVMCFAVLALAQSVSAGCYCEASSEGFTAIYFDFNPETGQYETYPLDGYLFPTVESCQEALISNPVCS